MSVHSLKERELLKELERVKLEYQELLRDTIRMVMASLALKDSVTGGHSIRVSHYALMIGRAMGLDQDELVALELGALLHDIGKMGVPDHILSKPSGLTDDEFEVMKKHPELSAEILSKLKVFKGVVPIVRHHQEKYDGTGYPDGLKGTEIPFLSRIVYVADAFDAMTADRPYRKAFTENIAFQELEKNAGRQFDPQIVKAFKKGYTQAKGVRTESEFFSSERRKKAVGE